MKARRVNRLRWFGRIESMMKTQLVKQIQYQNQKDAESEDSPETDEKIKKKEKTRGQKLEKFFKRKVKLESNHRTGQDPSMLKFTICL